MLFDARGVRNPDWSTNPIARFPEVPDTIAVHLVNRPGQPFLGVGEVVQGPTAAALGNVIRSAKGVRLCDLPMRAAHVKAILTA